MKFLLLLFLLLPACHKTPINIYIDPAFSPTQIKQIHNAFDLWSNNSSLSLSHNNSSPHFQIFYANKGWKKNTFNLLTKNRETPIATTINKQIFIPPTNHSLFKIVAHELGHNFGCYHTNSPSYLFNLNPYLKIVHPLLEKPSNYINIFILF